MEQNGYDVSYISGIDAATNPGLLLNTKAYVDVGHDEYWTQPQFANVKAAADAGVNEAFLSGNQIYWDTSLASSFDSSHTPNRTVVEYKDIWSGAQARSEWNGRRRSGSVSRSLVDGNRGTPENSLSGTIFTVDDTNTLDNITIPASMSQLRFWTNTSIASGNGGTLTLSAGYEWDSDLDNGFRPAGLVDLSSTTKNVSTLLLEQRLDHRFRHGNAQPYPLSRHDERGSDFRRWHSHVVLGPVEPVRAVPRPHGAGEHGRATIDGKPLRRDRRPACDTAGQSGACSSLHRPP